jgi:hypothetical protein
VHLGNMCSVQLQYSIYKLCTVGGGCIHLLQALLGSVHYVIDFVSMKCLKQMMLMAMMMIMMMPMMMRTRMMMSRKVSLQLMVIPYLITSFFCFCPIVTFKSFAGEDVGFGGEMIKTIDTSVPL